MAKKIVIINYGVGNLYSIRKAVALYYSDVTITDDPNIILGANSIILPGVGSFRAGMDGLKKSRLSGVIKKFALSGKPVLGICLGAQLLMSYGYEFGKNKGLDLISGTVENMHDLKISSKIPHIGWNKVNLLGPEDSLFSSVKLPADFYFVHSYYLRPSNKKSILSQTAYGGKQFCSAVQKGNIFGVQFHPEKSGKNGLKIIENFVRLSNKITT
jgi:glutamine amidotransferase